MIVSYDTSEIDNYPEDELELEDLSYKWTIEGNPLFNIGDKVQFIYTLNRDGNTGEAIDLYEEMKNEKPIGTVIGFENRVSKVDIYGKEYTFLQVKFDDDKFNKANKIVDLIPMQFVKVN